MKQNCRNDRNKQNYKEINKKVKKLWCKIKVVFYNFNFSFIFARFGRFVSAVSLVSVVSVVSFRSFQWFHFGCFVSLFQVLVHAVRSGVLWYSASRG